MLNRSKTVIVFCKQDMCQFMFLFAVLDCYVYNLIGCGWDHQLTGMLLVYMEDCVKGCSKGCMDRRVVQRATQKVA